MAFFCFSSVLGLLSGPLEDVFDEADVLIGGEEAVEEGGVFGLVDEADDALEDADEFGEDFVAVDFTVLVQELHGLEGGQEAEVVETDFDAGHDDYFLKRAVSFFIAVAFVEDACVAFTDGRVLCF